MISNRLENLRKAMQQHQIEAYIIPTSDFHQSEYVSEYFKVREFITGFTGSTGTVLIDATKTLLWVDGRYFIQAEKELQDTDIIIMKIGLPNTPTLIEYITQQSYRSIGFDGRIMATKEALSLPVDTLVYQYDIVTPLWFDRPPMSKHSGFLYDLRYCGESRVQKLHRIRQKMKTCKHHLVTALDDIAWIFNLRGKDIPCNPLLFSYALINQEDAYLYIQKETLTTEDIRLLATENIVVKEYSQIYDDVKKLQEPTMLDTNTINYTLYQQISAPIVDCSNPSQRLKAIKNECEIKNTIYAHIKDGVAMTKFMYWLKTNIGNIPMDELSVSKTLKAFREQQDLFYDTSFDTICAYQENAALMHYKATPTSYKSIAPKGLLLIDSGGQYLDGTTDITRTFALGPITPEEKQDFTIVLKAMLRLQNARFLQGTSAASLDMLAREMVYQYGLDYRCGTGHGVGHFLQVHEGPNAFRPKGEAALQEPGMITTNEPGIYKEGKHGIRLENELLCVRDMENEYGTFLSFTPLTLCPIDIEAIDFSMLTTEEITQLDNYHHLVYMALHPYLSPVEKEWLTSFKKARK